MAKRPKRKSQTAARNRTAPQQPRLKMLRPASWHQSASYSTDHYIAHLLTELGRAGLTDELPRVGSVLSDLLEWLDTHPGSAYAKLVDWKWIDVSQMRQRLEKNWDAKPRIELTASITAKHNLSVRWYPRGWRDSNFNWSQTDRYSTNLIEQREWREPPDFTYFTGDDTPEFGGRPSNELMFLHDVRDLSPEPIESYGPYATYNRDVVDSILICAVRSAYESLIRQLQYSFEVAVLDEFDFVTREEIDDEDDPWSVRFPTHRVVAWSLEDAAKLKERRDREAEERRESKERADYDEMETTFGLSAEALVAAVVAAAAPKRGNLPRSAELTNREASKALRAAGYELTAGQVRYLRQLIERYEPELLPEALRSAPAPEPEPATDDDNVVRFRGTDGA